MINTLHVSDNALDLGTWETVESDSPIIDCLLSFFPSRFPETARIYHEHVAAEYDVTPDLTDPESIQRLSRLQGVFWVVVYPAGPAAALPLGGQLLLAAGLLVGLQTLSILTKPKQRPGPPTLQPLTGSPNNKLGDRQNVMRLLGRIPDIYGIVRAFPDLLQTPYTTYLNNRETEVCYMCVGRGTYILTDIREGDTLVNQVQEMSTAIYDPGTIPGSGSPSLQIGEPILDQLYVVRQVEAVNGQPMLAPNAHTFIGDIPNTTSGTWGFTTFKNVSPGFGEIRVGGTDAEIREKIKTGDKLDVIYPQDRTTAGDGFIINLEDFHSNKLDQVTGRLVGVGISRLIKVTQEGTGLLPDLTGVGALALTVVNVDPTAFFNVSVAIPAGIQTAWDRIDVYTAGLFNAGQVGNGACLITPQDHEWVGPFFMEASLLPGQNQLISCNFVAQDGLYADDGKNRQGFNVRVEIELTPANSNGFPSGAPIQVEECVILGAIASRNTKATTIKIVTVTPGHFLIRARRITRTPWQQDSPTHSLCRVIGPSTGYSGNLVPALAITGDRVGKNGSTDPDPYAFSEDPPGLTPPLYLNTSYLAFTGRVQEELRWTHCYSLATLPFSSLGDLTTIHTRTVASEGALAVKDRRLSCIADRQIQTWNGATFGGALVSNSRAENVLFSVLLDPKIGNMASGDIDFAGIAAAFALIRTAFGGPTSDGFGGDQAAEFNYTFDNEDISAEDTIAIICQACFATAYRDGALLKVKPDISTVEAQLLVNHRNRLPGSEQRNVRFGTEAEFNGVRIEYVDTDINNPTDDAIKIYTIPPNSVATRPKIIEVPGVRLRKHAAWHAWRAYHRILYQNMTVQFESCQEAMRLTVMDRFLLSDGTRASTQDGEIVDVTGLTVTTSQTVSIVSGPHTIFLQHTDGTVESIAVASSPNGRQLVLATAPLVTLVTAADANVRTMYILVQNTFATPKAFHVQERTYSGKGTYSITGTNYSHAYYWNDGLMFWLPFIIQSGLLVHRDWGPYELTTTSTATTTADGTRGTVYLGNAPGDFITITSANVFASQTYTKAAWVNWDGGSSSSIISSPADDDEEFYIHSAGTLVGAHGGIGYVQEPSFPTGVWKHVALTYNHVTLVMTMYIDGENVALATSVPGRGIGNLRIFGGIVGDFLGKGDEVRYWMRELAAEEIRELYQKTRL